MILRVLVLLFCTFQVLLGQEDIVDPSSLDQTKLEEEIFKELLKYRQGKGQSVEMEDDLDKLSNDFQLLFQSRHFYSASKYQARINKEISNKVASGLKYPGTLIESVVCSEDAIAYKGGKFHFHRTDNQSTHKLYYGERNTNNQGYENLIPFETYNGLAKKVVASLISGPSKKMIKSGAYRDIGISTIIDYKTLHRNRIPQVKIIVILGGDQTALLKELIN